MRPWETILYRGYPNYDFFRLSLLAYIKNSGPGYKNSGAAMHCQRTCDSLLRGINRSLLDDHINHRQCGNSGKTVDIFQADAFRYGT